MEKCTFAHLHICTLRHAQYMWLYGQYNILIKINIYIEKYLLVYRFVNILLCYCAIVLLCNCASDIYLIIN